MADTPGIETRMDAASFMAWYDLQPDGPRYELLNGRTYDKGLGVHTFYCSPCRRFRRQLLRLNASCESLAAEFMPPAEAGLTAEARDRIAAEIERTRAG